MLPDGHRPLSEFLKLAVLLSEATSIPTHTLKLLLSHITGLSLPELALHPKHQISSEEGVFWKGAVERLLKHEPLQYIVGFSEFYGLCIGVNENVLIPRPETEGLVEWIVSSEKGELSVLDIGTGSGAVALALKHLNPDLTIIGTDISNAAVKQARRNAFRLGLEVTFLKADLFPHTTQKFDIIVSNPPYISPPDYEKLDDEVRYHEPRLALLARGHGLEFYRRIIHQAPKFLYPKGKIYFEIGETQADAISQLAFLSGFAKVELRQDLAGRDRYLRLTLQRYIDKKVYSGINCQSLIKDFR